MENRNALVVMDEAKLEEARQLDLSFDLCTSRLIRWVKFGISPKSLVCGLAWEKQQIRKDTGGKWWLYEHYMPNRPVADYCNWSDIPWDHTSMMDSEERWEWEKRKNEIILDEVFRKLDAGLALNEEEDEAYQAHIHPRIPWRNLEEESQGWANLEANDNWNCPEDIAEGKLQGEWLRPKNPASLPPPSVNTSSEMSISSSNTRGGCRLEMSYPLNLLHQYEDGVRGRFYRLPAGLGCHGHKMPYWDEVGGFWDINCDDVLYNRPSDVPYVLLDKKLHWNNLVQANNLLMIEAAPYAEAEEDISLYYGVDFCHRNNSWLVKENPGISAEMMLEYQENIERNKNEAIKTLDWLKLFGTNFELLTPMVHSIMKDPKLCQAIHAELVKRDIGYLKVVHNEDLQLNPRLQTVFANLHRWATMDIESAMEDIRLILEDHELMFEIINGLNGINVSKEKRLPIMDPNPIDYPCGACKMDLKQLGVIFGSGTSTLMAVGCRICEDTRLKRAQRLLWKWYMHPELLDDEVYKMIFAKEKGAKRPEEKNVISIWTGDDAITWIQ